MAAETLVLLAFTLFQVVCALALFQRRDEPVRPARVLAALLLLNATLCGISVVRSAGLRGSSMDWAEKLVDLPTAGLLAAFFFLRSGLRHRERWALAALGVSALQLAATLALPELQSTWYVPFVAYPYYAALTAVILACAAGSRWEKWIALAFLPRVYYFFAQAVFQVSSTGDQVAWGIVANHVGVYVMSAICLWAVWRLAQAPEAIPRSVLFGGLLIGPAMAAAHATFPTLTDSANAALSFVTLGFVRPLFTIVALALDQLRAVVARTILASGLGALVATGGPYLFGYPAVFCALLGIGAGLVALAAADAAAGSSVIVTHPAGPPSAEPAPRASPSAAPQWQRLMALLRGSSRPDALARLAWTQKELSARTGISVQRVSEFAASMNATAATKLDSLLPGWRDECPEGTPALVEVHKGAVEGASGVRVYYRLTEWGERMASKLVLTDPNLTEFAWEDSARNPPHDSGLLRPYGPHERDRPNGDLPAPPARPEPARRSEGP